MNVVWIRREGYGLYIFFRPNLSAGAGARSLDMPGTWMVQRLFLDLAPTMSRVYQLSQVQFSVSYRAQEKYTKLFEGLISSSMQDWFCFPVWWSRVGVRVVDTILKQNIEGNRIND